MHSWLLTSFSRLRPCINGSARSAALSKVSGCDLRRLYTLAPRPEAVQNIVYRSQQGSIWNFIAGKIAANVRYDASKNVMGDHQHLLGGKPR